jgi:hypothetical protein
MEQDEYVCSRTKNEVYFANNFDKFAYIVIGFASAIYITLGYSNSLKVIFFVLIFVIPCLILFAFHFKKTAYKLVFDLKKGEVEFHMFRNGGVIVNKLESIQKVQISGYMTFYLGNGKKIIWKKRAKEEDLLDLLRKVTKVETGGLF